MPSGQKSGNRPKLYHAYNILKLLYILVIFATLYVLYMELNMNDTQSLLYVSAYVYKMCEYITASTVLVITGTVLLSMVT